MGRRPTVDYKEIEKEYVTTELSYRELARRHGINFSTLAAKGRTEDWPTKRQSYQQSLSRKTYEKIADKVSSEEAQIRQENVLTLRLGIRRFAEDAASRKVSVSAADAVKMIEALAKLTTEPDQVNPDASINAVPVGPPDADLLRRIVDAARGRIDPDRVVEGTALPVVAGPRPN